MIFPLLQPLYKNIHLGPLSRLIMLESLMRLRQLAGESKAQTIGLSDETIKRFCEHDSKLGEEIEEASNVFDSLIDEFGIDVISQDESDLISSLQTDYINFYSAATMNPYVAIAARGPWVITSRGAVIHDNGGYGMLGGGHGPREVIDSMTKNWVMANVMTPSFSQSRLADRLKKELGHSRGDCPFSKFICMNSGSESVTVSLRIADVNAN